ncbi:MAG: hypothetical protein GF344_04980, partial [Chitinivibrionales bacterium]|nr:hypothetical protein [Chitinivibrionales bacterium]MBD3356354.1 hypothetical protein [Chitinivibrionales bacterium]
MLFFALTLISLVTTPSQIPETKVKAPRRIVTTDSARIVTPRRPRVLEGSSTFVRIEPYCRVGTVELLAHYHPGRVDTIARLTKAPFAATWRFDTLPDQDQFHLRFGYVIHHPNGDTIVSPPLPNNWVIDRNSTLSQRRTVCPRVASDSSITVDGKLGEWKRYQAEMIGDEGTFRCAWTAGRFFVAVEVNDDVITAFDRIEVMFDPKQERGSFAGLDQRVISFGPKNRSFAWAVRPGYGVSSQSDSIIVRIQDEVEWRSRLTVNGYCVEAGIPFGVLSDLEFPRKHLGFDLCIVNS